MSPRQLAIVNVEVATGWTSPDAPREIDEPATRDDPDAACWLAGLDALGPAARLGLHGRTLTQLVAGEPVEVIEERDDWTRVAALWQPSSADRRGYPAWVRRAHLRPVEEAPRPPSPAGVARDRVAICEAAHDHLGLRYLWGGTTRHGLDCSGLVHLSYRRAGVVVPRDAHDQQVAATPVPLGAERPGDLYFFAREDGRVYHVGFVTGDRTMLHAPETGQLIEDAPLAESREATLVAAGRFLA